jgi:hypothetical protein
MVHVRWLLAGVVLACSFTAGVMDSSAAGQAAWRPPPARFNNQGLVSPFVELLRVPVNHDAAQPSRGAEATPSSEWSQDDDDVVLTIWVPQLDKSTARVLLSITTISFTGASKTGQRYKLEIEQLGGDILPGKATWDTMTDAVHVVLPKRSKGTTWTSLSASGHLDAQHAKSAPRTRSSRRQVAVNTTHKYSILEAEASDAELGEGRLIARNDKVGSVMTRLFTECSVRATGWWTYKVCHGRSVTQYHETSGPPESVTHLGSIQLEDGEDGEDGQGTGALESPGVFMAQYSKKLSKNAAGHSSRLHSAEIVYSFTGGDQCKGSATGVRFGAQPS